MTKYVSCADCAKKNSCFNMDEYSGCSKGKIEQDKSDILLKSEDTYTLLRSAYQCTKE